MSRSGKRKVAVVFGTRPEAIKLAPVVHELAKREEVKLRVCLTGQHREMVSSVLDVFGIEPDEDLELMTHGQTLSELSARTIRAVDRYLSHEAPDVVLVQGDTTTAFATALVAYYHQVSVGHVEAGLRTRSKYAPFPEEINRTLVAPIADHHFAPTAAAREFLLDEAIDPTRIHVTGNTVIDALLWMRERNRQQAPRGTESLRGKLESAPRMILVTGHRRESFGRRFEEMCLAMRDLAENHPEVCLVYPVHLNPKVQEPVKRILGGQARIHLIEPQPYPLFVWLMDQSYIVLTDSGGIQEEAPALGKPVLVMRETTERPEAIQSGNALLVGNRRNRIVEGVERLLRDPESYGSMASAHNPFGDGHASERIVDILCGREPEPWEG